MFYQYRGPGAPEGIPAETTAEELTRIYSARGELTPSAIVDESRPPEATLHPAFEWDDERAAERYREVQARQIVRSVTIVADPARREQMPELRAFVSVTLPGGDGARARTYRPIVEVLTERPEEAAALKTRLRREIEALRQRYQNLVDADELLHTAFEQTLAATGS